MAQTINSPLTNHYDILIVGAGPAGSLCALALKDAGLKVALIDKASSYPRDKICGDAVIGNAVKVLNSIDPAYAKALELLPLNQSISSTRLINHTKREVTFEWKLKAYNCKRIVFDNFLFDLVKQHTSTEIFLNHPVNSVEVSENRIRLNTHNNNFTASIVVGCDGAHSFIAKKMAGFSVDRNHYSGAVRFYCTNIKTNNFNTNEVFFSKKYMPGYFWIFPIAENQFNIGFGMLSKTISEKKVNLTKAIFEVIDEFPELKERFKEVNIISEIQGFGLPIGTRKLPISGERFLLCGDAASLIDPLSGDGIANAMLSGVIAAKHIINHSKTNSFSKEINLEYDKCIYEKIGPELSRNTSFLRICSRFPVILNFGIYILSKQFPFYKTIRKIVKF